MLIAIDDGYGDAKGLAARGLNRNGGWRWAIALRRPRSGV